MGIEKVVQRKVGFWMKYGVKVLVQLPDGSTSWCNVVRETRMGPQAVTHESKRRARDWTTNILPQAADIYPIEEAP